MALPDRPLVSICSITYNHGAYIAQAMESWLMQETDFDLEIVVGDDASTDDTQDILNAYAKKHPDKVRLMLRKENVGVARNFIETIRSCRGKYVALCEGDDYWTDPKKLAVQVAFLEANPDFSICFHRVEVVFSGIEPFAFRDNNADTPEVSGFELLVKGNYLHTPSVLFRQGLALDYPEALMDFNIADWPLHLLNARNGKIQYINRTMAAYRISKSGIWSQSEKSKQITQMVHMLQALEPSFSGNQAKQVRRSIGQYSRYLLKLLLLEKKFKASILQAPTLVRNMLKANW